MNIKFTPLKEEAASKDDFQHGTHERVAETLFSLIKNNKGQAQTIGLEGVWGSGKSSVIKILKNKLSDKEFMYFYFDTWAHEGDPLRRIFLESLIDSVKGNNPELENLKNRISNRKREINTITRKQATPLGKFLSISLFFVPLGAAIISTIDFSQKSFNTTGELAWDLLFGTLLSIAPLFVLAYNLFYLVFKRKPLWNSKNWAFLESETETEITQEVSEDEERSSIEFERYFFEIIKNALNEDDNKQLVMVVDNLDRIDAEVSLKMWSTLQTFLQQRNPASNKNPFSTKVWIIVPYDVEGLSNLWNKEQQCAYDYFNKCFQFRLEVPKPVLTDWEDFAKQMVNHAFGSSFQYLNDVIEVFRITRKNINDIPTPREIKTYINQLGVYLINSKEEVTIRSVAYYTILRYIEKEKVNTIQNKLINGDLPDEKLANFLPKSIVKDLAGLSFGVSPDVGQQLLLEPEIEKSLKNNQTDKINQLVSNHGEGFWYLFDHHMQKTEPDILFEYSSTILKVLWPKDWKRCLSFINRVKYHSFKFTKVNDFDKHKSFILLLKDSKVSLKEYWNSACKFLEHSFSDNISNIELYLKLFKNITELVPETELLAVTIKSENIENWVNWSSDAIKYDIKIYEWIKPEHNLRGQLINKISAGKSIETGVFEAVQYFHFAHKANWPELIEKCKQHIQWNNGNPASNKHSSVSLKIIHLLSSGNYEHNKTIIELINNGIFHNFIYRQDKNPEVVLIGATLIGRFWSRELHAKKIQHIDNSQEGLRILRNFWITKNTKNANFVIETYKDDIAIIWELCKDNKNKLIAEIINVSLSDNHSELFNVENSLPKLHNALTITQDNKEFDNNKLVKRFINFSNLKSEIKGISKETLFEYCQALSYCIPFLDDLSTIENTLQSISKEEWDKEFEDDGFLSQLIIDVKKKDQNFSLQRSYYESILQYSKSIISEDKKPSDWIIDEWYDLVLLLNDDYLNQFKDNITVYFSDHLSFEGFSFLKANLHFVNKEQISSRNLPLLKQKIEEGIKIEDDIEKLKSAMLLLKGTKTKFDNSFKNVITDPLNTSWNATNNEDFKATLENIASFIGIKLIEVEEE